MQAKEKASKFMKGWRVGETRTVDGCIGGAFMQSLRTAFKKRGWHMAARTNDSQVAIKRLIVSQKAPK